MVKLTTSYQLLAQTYVGNTGYADVYLRLYAKYNSQSIANNTSSVSYKSTLYFSTGSFYTGSTTTKSLSGNGATSSSLNGAGTYYAGETTLNEITGTVTHNDNGAYTTGASATFVSTPWGWNATAQATADLPTIPRYATSNQSLNSKTETTITMNWSSDNTIDYLWYSKDGGTNWTGVDVTDGPSGTYKISGLTANTTYSIKTRVRRKDSQLTTDSSALSVTTYKVPSNSLNARTETTIKMNWSVDSTADYIWYSTDNGSTWTAVGSVSATSGTYTISGLSANTAYKVKTRVRRKATQTTYDASAVSVTTYNYPHITAVGTSNLTIGNSQKLTLYNPLSRTVTIKMYKDSTSGTQLYSGTTSSTSITFTPTASTLYATIPSAKSGKCVYSAIYSSSTKTTTGAYTYVINESACKPTFTNFTYVDIDSTVVTDNDQILVNNNSDCKIIISTANKAVAKNSATMVSYKCEYGSLSKTIDYSSNSEVSTWIAGATGGTLKVTAIDSRGLSTTVTKTVPYIAYTSAVVNSVEVQRLNGVDLETYLGLKMTIWKGNWQNGSDTAYDNQLKYVGYRVYDGSSWTSYFDITDTVKSNMSSSTSGSSTVMTVPLSKKLAIHADGSSGGFTVGKEYKIQVLIKDGTSTATFTPYSYQATAQGTVPDGKVGFSRYKDSDGNYHYAINGMPESDTAQTIYGDLRVLQGKYDEPKVSVSSGDYELDFLIGGSGTNRGIYDRTLGKWMCYINSDKKALFLGNADTATTATTAKESRNLQVVAQVGSDVSGTKGWYKVATQTMSNYGNTNILWYVKAGYSAGWYGLLELEMRSDSSNISAWKCEWAIRSGFSPDHVRLVISGMTWTLYVYNPSSRYGRIYFTEIQNKGIGGGSTYAITYYNSDTTVSEPTATITTTDCAVNKINITSNNPTSLTDYYPIWTSGDGKQTLYANNGCVYQTLEGTTSANGRGLLSLGNSKATGTAGNKFGCLRLYSKLAGYINLQYDDNSGSNTIFFPNYNGYAVVSTSGANYEKLSDGTLMIFGNVTCPSLASGKEANVSITFPASFVNTNYRVNLTATGTGVYWSFLVPSCYSKATGTCTIKFYNNGSGTAAACVFDFIAIGRWK